MVDDDDDVFVDAVTLPPELAAMVEQQRATPALAKPQVYQMTPPGRLRRWGSHIVVGDESRIVHLSDASTTPVTVPGLDRVCCVAGDTIQYAVGEQRRRLVVVRERGGGWEPLPSLPNGDAADAALGSQIEMYASGEALAVHLRRDGRGQFHWWTGQRWITREGSRTHVLVSSERLWLGYGSGEWGGGIEGLSATGSSFDIHLHTQLPVVSLAWTAEKSVLVAASLAHMSSKSMYVGVLGPNGTMTPRFVSDRCGAWMALSGLLGRPVGLVSGLPRDAESLLRDFRPDWPQSGLLRDAESLLRDFRPDWKRDQDTLVAVDVDEHGRIYLLTSASGLFCLDGETLTPLTPYWPRKGELSEATLQVAGDTAVISAIPIGLHVCTFGTSGRSRSAIPR
jgi:hypothetical protein